MNIALNLEQYKNDCVYFNDPIKNNIMNGGNFIRIIYSNSLFILNGISLFVPLNNANIEKYYNKYRCCFNTFTNKELIQSFKQIEEEILKNCNIKNKTPQHKLIEQFKNGNIKLFLQDEEKNINNYFILKISGIWETDQNYGLTYKFLNVKNILSIS